MNQTKTIFGILLCAIKPCRQAKVTPLKGPPCLGPFSLIPKFPFCVLTTIPKCIRIQKMDLRKARPVQSPKEKAVKYFRNNVNVMTYTY